MLAIIASAVVGIILILWLLKPKRPKNSPPIAHVGLPLIGNYVEFAAHPLKFATKCLEKYGCIYTVPMLHKNLTFLLGPEAATPFFKLGDESMSQPEVYKFMTPVFGNGIVYDAEPGKRYEQMQKMATGLRKERLIAYVPKIEDETIEYLRRAWGDSGEADILETLGQLIIMSASRCLHGDDVRSGMFDDVARLYHDLDKGTEPLSFFFPYLPTKAHKMRDEARKEMVKIFSKVINKRRAEGDVPGKDRSDILQLFIDMTYKDGSKLTDDNIVGLLIALLFAGQHTSSVTSTWTVMFLLFHPECLKKVLAEQQAVKGTGDYHITFDDLNKMEYLQCCVKEALRLHPPLILLMRMAMHDIETTVDGKKFVIPKGDICVASPQVSSRMASVFKNPDNFEPDRFGPERNEGAKQFAFLGFGGGRHACMGQQFGMLQITTLLSVLLRNYKIEPVEPNSFPEPDYTAMVVGPKNHLKVRYSKLPGAFF